MALSFLFSAWSCAGDAGPVQATDGTVLRGVVRDASDGSPVRNAKVTFTSDARDQAEDRTSGEGSFAMTVFSRSDSGRIEARKGGYSPAVVSVYLDDVEVTIDVDLQPE